MPGQRVQTMWMVDIDRQEAYHLHAVSWMLRAAVGKNRAVEKVSEHLMNTIKLPMQFARVGGRNRAIPAGGVQVYPQSRSALLRSRHAGHGQAGLGAEHVRSRTWALQTRNSFMPGFESRGFRCALHINMHVHDHA